MAVTMSVVTVCLNAAATLADTLESVAHQSHPAVEHVVMDGGSTDATPVVISAMAPTWRSS